MTARILQIVVGIAGLCALVCTLQNSMKQAHSRTESKPRGVTFCPCSLISCTSL